MAQFKAGVASGHPLVTEAASLVLSNGGNAFDAAVAAGFAAAVVEPALSSLGGGGFLLARSRDGGEILFDFFVDTPGKGLPERRRQPHFFPVTVEFPGSSQVFNIGLGSVAVPGNLKGFVHVHERLGRMDLAEIVAPAARYARQGVRLNGHQAYFISLLEPIMLFSSQGRRIFQKEGRYLSQGDILRNTELADFLDEIGRTNGRAVDDFYNGSIAEGMISEMNRGGGLLTMADLKSYRVKERRPLRARFCGHELVTNPPPSFGGFYIAISLELLERLAVKESCSWGDSRHLCLLARAMQQVEDYRKSLGFRLERPSADWFERSEAALRPCFSRGTTHVSICDREGNMASMTTSNGEGSGYFAPGTGIMLNNMMGEDDLHPEGFHSSPAGIRVGSMMSPSIIERQGRPVLVLGSGGSKRIRTALIQVVINCLCFQMPLKEAVEMPRIHWDGEIFQVEPGFDQGVMDAFSGDFPVNIWQDIDVYFGGVHVVDPVAGFAVGDPRRGGAAVVLDPNEV